MCESLQTDLEDLKTDFSLKIEKELKAFRSKEELKITADDESIELFGQMVAQYLKEKDAIEAEKIYRFENLIESIINF